MVDIQGYSGSYTVITGNDDPQNQYYKTDFQFQTLRWNEFTLKEILKLLKKSNLKIQWILIECPCLFYPTVLSLSLPI